MKKPWKVNYWDNFSDSPKSVRFASYENAQTFVHKMRNRGHSNVQLSHVGK
jgi:hypothetical protein